MPDVSLPKPALPLVDALGLERFLDGVHDGVGIAAKQFLRRHLATLNHT